MKNIKYIKAFGIVALLSVSFAVQAQEESTNYMNREMTLEREYDPSVQDANKVNTLPVIKDPEVRKIPIDYAGITMPAYPAKEIWVLPSGRILTDMEYNKRRGYLNLAGGMLMNLNGDLGYHILSTEKDQLNFYFSHRSTNGNVKYLDTEVKQKLKFNDNLGGLNYRHRFDRAIMRLGAKYGYSAFNYYGYAEAYNMDMDVNGLGDLTPVETDRKTMQVNQTIHAYAGVASTDDSAVGYDVGLDYTNFSYKYGMVKDSDGPSEHAIKGDINVYFPVMTDQWAGVRGQIKYFSYSTPSDSYVSEISSFREFAFNNYAEITLSPYYKISGGSWNILLGANIMFYTGDWNKSFMASPNIAFDVEIADRTLFYGEAKGELRSNSLYQIAQESRYANYFSGIEPTRNFLDATVGIKSGIVPGFWFNVFGGYKLTKGDYFLLPGYVVAPGYAEDRFSSLSILGDMDTKLFFGGAQLKYSYQKFFDIHLKGVYNHWTTDFGDSWQGGLNDEGTTFGRPKMELTARITVRPIDKVALDLNYYLGTDRYTTKALIGNVNELKVDNINDLNLTASYRLNDTFGFYVKLNNLLFQKYELYYGYPVQGFTAMGGININF